MRTNPSWHHCTHHSPRVSQQSLPWFSRGAGLDLGPEHTQTAQTGVGLKERSIQALS